MSDKRFSGVDRPMTWDELANENGNLKGMIDALLREVARLTAERDTLLDEQAQQIFTLTGNAAEISGKLTQAWIDLARVTAENNAMKAQLPAPPEGEARNE